MVILPTPLSEFFMPIQYPTPSQRRVFLQWLLDFVKYVAIFLLIYFAINWWRQPVMPANAQLKLTDYQGQTLDLQAISEQSPTLLYFWGSWCGVCSLTSDKVNTLAKAGHPVVTIAVKSGDNGELHRYLQQNNLSFVVINDDDGQIFNRWQGQVTPSYLILSDGKITQGMTGIQPLWSLKLRLWISQL